MHRLSKNTSKSYGFKLWQHEVFAAKFLPSWWLITSPQTCWVIILAGSQTRNSHYPYDIQPAIIMIADSTAVAIIQEARKPRIGLAVVPRALATWWLVQVLGNRRLHTLLGRLSVYAVDRKVVCTQVASLSQSSRTVCPQAPWAGPLVNKPLKSATHGQYDAKATVTFPAAGHHRPLTGAKLYCLVTELHVCEQLAQGCYLRAKRPRFEPSSFSAMGWSQGWHEA